MAEDAGSIYSEIRIELSKLTSDIKSVNTAFDKLVKTNDTQSEKVKKSWTSKLKDINLAGVAAFAAIAIAVKKAVESFGNFDEAMVSVQAESKGTTADLQALEEAALSMGSSTEFSAKQAADALTLFAKKGFDAAESIKLLESADLLAEATNSELNASAKILAETLKRLGLEAEDSGRLADVFAGSQIPMEQLSQSLTYISPLMKGFNMSLEESVAIMKILNESGMGQLAAPAIRLSLSMLGKETDGLTKKLAKYGLTYKDVNPATNSFAQIIGNLGRAGLKTSDILNIFGNRAGPVMATLLEKGQSAVEDYTDALSRSGIAAEKKAITDNTLNDELKTLTNAFEVAGIKIVKEFETPIRSVVQFVTKLINGFSNLPQPLKIFIGVLAGGIPIIMGVVGAVAVLGSIIGTIAGPITLVVAGIAALAAGISWLVGQSDRGSISLETLTKNLADINKEIEKATNIGKAADSIGKLTDEYENLKKKTNLTQKEQDRLKQIIKEITDIAPSAATAWDDMGNAIEISGGKARIAANEMKNLQKATLEEQLSKLKLQEALFKETVRRDKEEVERIQKDRSRLAGEGLIAQQRIALINKFQSELERSTSKGGSTIEERFVSIIHKMSDEFKKVGINTDIGFTDAQAAITYFTDLLNSAENKLKELRGATEKETKVEINYKKAKEALDQINELQKKIKDLQDGKSIEIPINDDKTEKSTKTFLKASKAQIETLNKLIEAKKKHIETDKNVIKSIDDLIIEIESQSASEIRLLEIERDRRIKESQMSGASQALIQAEIDKINELYKIKIQAAKDKTAIDTQTEYDNKLKELNKTTDDNIDAEQEKALAIVRGSTASKDAVNSAIVAINNFYDALKDKKATDDTKKMFDDLKKIAEDFAFSIGGSLTQLFSSITDARIEELDRQMQAELDAAGLSEQTTKEKAQKDYDLALQSGNQETIIEKKRALDKATIEEEYQKKKAQLQYKGELATWTITLLQTVAEGARAVVHGLMMQPFIPVGIAAGATAGTLAGIQIAAVNKAKPQPPKLATGGIVLPVTGGRTTIQAENDYPELDINAGPEGAPLLNVFANRIADIVAKKQSIVNLANYNIIDGLELSRNVVKHINAGNTPPINRNKVTKK